MTSRTLPPKPGGKSSTAAPKQLDAPERRLWSKITATHEFRDAASLALLASTLEALMRARRCREQINCDGEAVKDRWGQLKAHPLLTPETHSRAAFLAGMKALRLDLTGVET